MQSLFTKRGLCSKNLGTIQGIPSELQYYYHARQHVTSAPWKRKMPSRSPCPKAAEAIGRRPGAGRRRVWESRGHFGRRCCLTAGATTDHSLDAPRLRHPCTGTCPGPGPSPSPSPRLGTRYLVHAILACQILTYKNFSI
jgi:hypothetical protein